MVTNEHVVEGQSLVSVTVDDSTTYSGTVLGVDAVRDLAVVSICCGDFTALEFGDAAGCWRRGMKIVNYRVRFGASLEQATVTKRHCFGMSATTLVFIRRMSFKLMRAINPGQQRWSRCSRCLKAKFWASTTFGYTMQRTSGRPVEGTKFRYLSE